jgi:DNA-directed RNA polymerase specialized sigma24 family protein
MLVEDEQAREVVTAFATLSLECQQLLRLLTTEPPLSYEQISDMVGRPVGSLGPTRSRCLERLKSAMTSRISGAGGGSFKAEGDAR